MRSQPSFDVVVIGGGPAGLNGALMLARSRRSVLVVDAGEPRNAVASGVHGLLGHDGVPAADLLARGRAEVERYGGRVVTDRVSEVTGEVGDFTVRLAGGTAATARRLLVTTGLVDELPSIPGLAERWGRDVLHCVYCHGWEVRDRTVGVLGIGPGSAHQALMFRQLTDDVVYLRNGTPLGSEQLGELTACGVRVLAQEVEAVETQDDQLSGVLLDDGTRVPLEALAVSPRSVPRDDLLTSLGLRPVEHPSGLGAYVAIDDTCRTVTPGVWAAGNVVDPAAQVGGAAAAGAWAGAQINADLVGEDTRAAVAAHSRAQAG
jgi:thioredoxin reductase